MSKKTRITAAAAAAKEGALKGSGITAPSISSCRHKLELPASGELMIPSWLLLVRRRRERDSHVPASTIARRRPNL